MGGGVVAVDGQPSALQVRPVHRSGVSQFGNLPKRAAPGRPPTLPILSFPPKVLGGSAPEAELISPGGHLPGNSGSKG